MALSIYQAHFSKNQYLSKRHNIIAPKISSVFSIVYWDFINHSQGKYYWQEIICLWTIDYLSLAKQIVLWTLLYRGLTIP